MPDPKKNPTTIFHRPKFGAVLWFFFGLVVLFFSLKHHRIDGWNWNWKHSNTLVFTSMYSFAGICFATACGMWIYGMRGFTVRFTLRGLMVFVTLIALALALTRFFLLDSHHYQRLAVERGTAGDLNGAAAVMQRFGPSLCDDLWKEIARKLANAGNLHGAVNALCRLSSETMQEFRLKELARSLYPSITHFEFERFALYVEEAKGTETRAAVVKYAKDPTANLWEVPKVSSNSLDPM